MQLFICLCSEINDFSEFFWLSAQEIIQKDQEDELMKDTLPLTFILKI